MGIYTKNPDYKSGKEVIEAFKRGDRIEVYQPGPFGPTAKDGPDIIEGPPYPQPHRFYVGVQVTDGVVTAVSDPKNSKKAFRFKDGELVRGSGIW